MGTQPSDQSLNGRTTNYFVIVMKTSPLFSALLLLGFASSGLATWDWSLDNIANFKTNISAELMQGCLGEAKANEFGEGLMQCPTSPSEAIEGNWMLSNAVDRTNLTCGQVWDWRNLLRHEICAANVCQSTKNTRDKYGNLDWNRIHWIYNMSAIDEKKDGESMSPKFLIEIRDCKNEAMQFLRDNYGTIRRTAEQGARQNDAGTRLGCNEGRGIPVGIPGQRNIGPYRKVLKRVLISNCVKRAFVNRCAEAEPAGGWGMKGMISNHA